VKIVNVHEAKTHLSKLLKQVEGGEEVVIANAGRPIARMIPFVDAGEKRKLGFARGTFVLPEDFNDPLPDEILEDFYR